ncbi:MAG: hypothetical protein J6B12_02025 [Clostridia bacterium]|nr:hypothetical protein [Clostridia bacterium]
MFFSNFLNKTKKKSRGKKQKKRYTKNSGRSSGRISGNERRFWVGYGIAIGSKKYPGAFSGSYGDELTRGMPSQHFQFGRSTAARDLSRGNNSMRMIMERVENPNAADRIEKEWYGR